MTPPAAPSSGAVPGPGVRARIADGAPLGSQMTESGQAPHFAIAAAAGGALAVEGELDLSTVGALHSAVSRAREAAGAVEVDLSGVSFADCVAVRAFLELSEQDAPAAPRVRFARPSAPVRRIVELTRTGDALSFAA